jgi:hypothetical protein
VPYCPWSAVASSSDLPSCCGTFCLVPYEYGSRVVQERHGE